MAARTFVVGLFCASFTTAYYDIDDSLLYKIDFPGPSKTPVIITDGSVNDGPGSENLGDASGGSGLSDLLEEELETVEITSIDNEKYRCTLPKVGW